MDKIQTTILKSDTVTLNRRIYSRKMIRKLFEEKMKELDDSPKDKEGDK